MARRKSIEEKAQTQTRKSLEATARLNAKIAARDAAQARKDAAAQVKLVNKRSRELVRAAKAYKKLDAYKDKAYRAKIRKAQKYGLLKTVDAKTAERGNAGVEKVLSKFNDLIAGRSVLKKAPKNVRDKAKAAGYRTIGDAVVIPRMKGERIYVDAKKGEIYKRSTYGGRRVKTIQVLERPQNFDVWARQQKEIHKDAGAKWYGFTMFGNEGYNFYRDIDELIKFLEKYTRTIDVADEEELLDELVIFEYETDARAKKIKENSKRKAARKESSKKFAAKKKQQYRRYVDVKNAFVKFGDALGVTTPVTTADINKLLGIKPRKPSKTFRKR